MDKPTENLLNAALATAKKLGVPATLQRAPEGEADAVILIGKGRRARQYLAEIKRGLRPATLGATLHQIERYDKPGLLIADYVTPPMAETLKDRGIAFFDAAGNAFLDQPPIYLWIKGERPREETLPRTTVGRAFRPGGLKVIFALLCHPEWVDRPYREIAAEAGVAHGTVGWVMTDLQDLGFVADIDQHRRLLQRERLLKQWAEAYARTLRPKLVLQRYRTDLAGWWKNLNVRKYGVQFGGEAAEAQVTRRLRPETITLYTKKIDPRLLVDFALKKDAAGPAELVERFWTFEDAENATVPLPLIYADLLVTGDARCLEAADLIYERIVNGFV
ncbi:MAG TPA: type IV toxin-antitoxin system AbiEi family antitoxin [Gammaproteobacteria bacterium]|nr:type IV toxin-antitoxin system AbiEi family antitoxin [Gammaproteobacteria bacterium]